MVNRLVFAVVIFIIVLLLLRQYIADEITSKHRLSGKKGPQTGDLAVLERAEKTPPSHVPYYTSYKKAGGVKRVLADYTPVPANQARIVKKVENPKNFVIDRKFTYFGEGGRIAPTELPENLSKIDLKLAAKMADKPVNEIAHKWRKISTEEIGRMLEETRETIEGVNTALEEAEMSDKDINYQYQEEEEFVKSLPISFECENIMDDCDVWKEENGCIINPKYMYENCPKSCGACSLTKAQKARLAQIYEERESPNCVYQPGYVDTSGMYN